MNTTPLHGDRNLNITVSEINAEWFTPTVWDEEGNSRPMTAEEYDAEFERRKGRTFFSLRAFFRGQVATIQSSMRLPESREEALADAFAHLGRIFFHRFQETLPPPVVRENPDRPRDRLKN